MADRDTMWINSMQEGLEAECRELRIRHRADTIFLIVMGGRVIAMQSGFAMVEAAFVRPLNAANIMMKNLMDMFLGCIVFFYAGYRVGFPELPQFEDSNFDFSMWFLQFSYATTAATIDSGALAGRVSFIGYLILSCIMTGAIYPVVVQWVWGGGWLQQDGYIDFAGSSVVHVVGAASAFVCICVCGPRVGRFPYYRGWRRCCKRLCAERFNDEYYRGPVTEVEQRVFTKVMPINNPVQALFGLFLLIVGFLAFNPASTLATTENNDLLTARTTVTTLLAASGGALASFMVGLCRRRSPVFSIPEMTTTTIAGMVASCACCHVIPPSLCLLVGFLGGIVADVTNIWLLWFQLDDVVGAIAAHGPPGALGVIAVPIFAKPHCQSDVIGLVYGGGDAAWTLLRVQVVGIIAITAFTMAATYIVVILIDLVCGFRSERATEIIGHDYVEHGFRDKDSNGEVLDFLKMHSPVRDCLTHRIKNAHSPTKPYDPGQESAEPPPPAKDAMAEISSLRKELQSLRETVREIRAGQKAKHLAALENASETTI